MKVKTRLHSYYIRIVLVAILLLGLGLVMLIHESRDYMSFLQKDQDKQLQGFARSVDKTMLSIYNQYLNELNYVCSRKDFLTAETEWYQTGDAHNLLERLDDNLLQRVSGIETVTAAVDGQVFLSTNNKMDYYGIPASAMNSYQDIQICSDYQGTPYLAFLQKKGDIVYAAIMNLNSFYHLVENNSGLKSYGRFILTDANRNVYIHRENGNIKADLLVNEGEADQPLLQMLLKAQKTGSVETRYYNGTTTEEVNTSSLRVSLLPTKKSENGVFAIGIVKDSRENMDRLKLFSMNLLMFGSLILASVFLLLYCIMRYSRQEERNLQQIRILQEKKTAMEELNRETQKLAHHQRLETIGQLTSGIAHDFNNLLTPMMGYSLMVMERLPQEDTESYDNLLEIYNASKKAKDLISRLSDLSRKNTVLTMKYIHTDKIIQDTLSMLEPAKPKTVTLVSKLNGKDAWLYGNETQLSQIIMNLVINAYQVLEETGGKVEVSSWVTQDKIHIRVKDNGPGIPKENRKKIFDPFFTTKPIGQGTGLGLAIVSQMVEEHQGVIDLESLEGQFTQFTLTFPIQVFQD